MAPRILAQCWPRTTPSGSGLSLATRCLQLSALALVAWWVFGCLGGVGFAPTATSDGGNDTSPVFNWHPLVMVLAFPVLMGEALLAYRDPAPTGIVSRPAKKVYHVSLQIAALTLALLGFMAALRSHTLKRPTPIPNFYSPHSFLGLAVLLLLIAQAGLGMFAYVFPKLTLPQRTALSPVHIFLGRSIFALGLAAAATGLQEKATFLQAFGKAGVTTAAVRLPAVLLLLLASIALCVLWQHAPRAPQSAGGIVSVTAQDFEAVPLFDRGGAAAPRPYQ